jgi:hypothetical protein
MAMKKQPKGNAIGFKAKKVKSGATAAQKEKATISNNIKAGGKSMAESYKKMAGNKTTMENTKTATKTRSGNNKFAMTNKQMDKAANRAERKEKVGYMKRAAQAGNVTMGGKKVTGRTVGKTAPKK